MGAWKKRSTAMHTGTSERGTGDVSVLRETSWLDPSSSQPAPPKRGSNFRQLPKSTWCSTSTISSTSPPPLARDFNLPCTGDERKHYRAAEQRACHLADTSCLQQPLLTTQRAAAQGLRTRQGSEVTLGVTSGGTPPPTHTWWMVSGRSTQGCFFLA